jgi:nucleoside-diphosphate-sugar epimerase
MTVMVTGGTGFVGSAIVAALLERGHTVRLLARDPDRVSPALDQHGPGLAQRVEVCTGDATDPAAVADAVSGADAVVHAAAVFSFDPSRRAEIARTNVRAAQVVLTAGAEAGCRRVVHVSSQLALLRRDGDTTGLPLGDVELPYTKSKVDSERVARRLQDEGAPVVSIYPGAVHGPRDHYVGEQANRLRWVVRGLFPLWPPGGLHSVDVRDVAACVTEIMSADRERRRWVVPGHHVDATLFYGAVERALGRRRPHVTPPAWFLRPVCDLTERANRLLPERLNYPANREALECVVADNRFDDTPARQELGVIPRSWDVTVRDTIAWLVQEGHLPARYRPRHVDA